MCFLSLPHIFNKILHFSSCRPVCYGVMIADSYLNPKWKTKQKNLNCEMTFGHFRNQRLKKNIQQHARTQVDFNSSKVVLRVTQIEERWVGHRLGCSRRPRKGKDDRLLENHSFTYSQSSRRYGSTSHTQSTHMRRHGHHPNQPSYGFL